MSVQPVMVYMHAVTGNRGPSQRAQAVHLITWGFYGSRLLGDNLAASTVHFLGLPLLQVRVVDCYSEPHAFVEVSETAPWRLLHINQAALRMTGEHWCTVQDEGSVRSSCSGQVCCCNHFAVSAGSKWRRRSGESCGVREAAILGHLYRN